MGYLLQTASTARPLLFLMVDSADHITGKTGLTPTVTISKNGAAFAAPAGAVTELASGWYKVAGNATDTGTTGPLLLHATSAGADPCDAAFEVVAFNPDDGVRLGLTALPAVAAGANGGLPTGDASGRVLLQPTQTGVTIPTVTAVTNRVSANTDQLAGQTVTAAAGVTFPSSVASPTNITAGTLTTVTTVTTTTNLTNLPTVPTNWLTAAGIAADAGTEIAGAVWDLATTGHTTSGTFGAAVVAAGGAGDPWSTSLPGSYGAGTAGNIIGNRIDAAVTSRMATYTQPTGFLAATFPATVASTTNITAGTLTTVTNLTNLPAITSNWLTAAGIAAGALNGKGDWLLSSGYTAPPSSATVSAAVWDLATTGHTTSGTFGAAATSGVGGLTQQQVRDAMKLAPTGGAAAVDSVDDKLDDLLVGGGDSPGVTTLLTRVPGLVMQAAAYTAPDNAGVAAVKVVTDKMGTGLELDGSVYRWTINSLEQAPSGTGATTQQIRDAMLLAPSAGTPAPGSIDAYLVALGDLVIAGVATGTPTTTMVAGNPELSATDDLYNNMFLVFTSGVLKGLPRKITDYVGSTKTFTVVAFPLAATVGDEFAVIGSAV